MDPVVCGGFRGKIFLRGIPSPRLAQNAGSERLRDFASPVRRAAIDYQDFIHATQAFDGARDIPLLIQRHDCCADLHGYSLMGAIMKHRIKIQSARTPSLVRETPISL